MRRFQLWDYYENYGLVDDYETLGEAIEAANDWREDCEGECELVIKEYNKELDKYIEIAETAE